MTAIAATADQVEHPDGRVELTVPLAESPYSNDDLAPVPVTRRTWTTYHFCALWVGMAINIPSYLLASSLIGNGMDWLQAVLTIGLANVIVLIPMLLTGHAGTRFGIPFPVFARLAFGLRGANLPALIRALVACCWFGIQTWVGGQAVFALVGKAGLDGWTTATSYGGHPWTMWLSFGVFWIVQMVIIMFGMEAVRRTQAFAAPLLAAVTIALAIWMVSKAGGLGPILDRPSTIGWGFDFWKLFGISLMGMIGFWSTLALNIPDFTRFGGSQRAQILGQTLGLPTTMAAFAFLSVLITSGSAVVYGAAIWNPVDLVAQFDSVAVVLIAMFAVLVATISTNIAANTVSPAYDISHLAPRHVNFRIGALITGVVGVVIQPWRLVDNPDVYIYDWLTTVGGLLGTVAGVLIADYWVLRRTNASLVDLYSPTGRYWYSNGWNWNAVAAVVVGGVLAIGGAHFGPFPSDGLIPFLRDVYDYGWIVGMATAAVVYLLLSREGAR